MRIVFLGNFSVDYSSESHHAKSLEALGHEVVRLQEAKTGWRKVVEETKNANLFVHIHTHGWWEPGSMSFEEAIADIKSRNIPVITYHLDLWKGLAREKDLETDPFYKHLDYFFATDKLMCDWFNENTDVKGVYLPAGVFHEECYIAPKPSSYETDILSNEIIFVGSKGYHPEWEYRPRLINWLRETYGADFLHVGGDGDTGTVRGHRLNKIYANSKVSIGDSLVLNYDYPYYWSDRVYEAMGRGGFLIMPWIKGLDEQFEDKKHLVFYKFNDFIDLKEKIDYYLNNDEEREAIRLAGHEEVKDKHTYKHRWQTILDTVNESK